LVPDAGLAAPATSSPLARVHAQDANDVVILQDVADVAKARTWFGSDDLKAAMQKSGIMAQTPQDFSLTEN
jgi:hypothetical protein